jgi:hypothetical protein
MIRGGSEEDRGRTIRTIIIMKVASKTCSLIPIVPGRTDGWLEVFNCGTKLNRVALNVKVRSLHSIIYIETTDSIRVQSFSFVIYTFIETKSLWSFSQAWLS